MPWGFPYPYCYGYSYPYAYPYPYPYTYPPAYYPPASYGYSDPPPAANSGYSDPPPATGSVQYVQRSQVSSAQRSNDPPPLHWYYCPSAKKYYPSVKKCREPWIKVPPPPG